MVAAVAAGFAAVSSGAAQAELVVVDFESLDGTGVVGDGYGGIIWDDNFSFYDTAETPFTPKSGSTVAFTNYAKASPGVNHTQAFRFAVPVSFQGAWFSGKPFNVKMDYYLAGTLVGSSALLLTSADPTFLAGPRSAVDEVRVSGNSGNWVMDDVTYNTVIPTGVPEPATWALMIGGFGLTGLASGRRRRRMLA
jgi:opacity protein-like surface antigen